MIWDKIISWFRDRRERIRFINEFNENAKEAFITGAFGVLLTAFQTPGENANRHKHSNFLMPGGFAIKVDMGRNLSKDEMLYIGQVILNDNSTVRKLYFLGWDTLRVIDLNGRLSVKWAIKDFVAFTHELSS